MIKPTQGRIVIYHEGQVTFPAMVTEVVSDTSVHLKVFTVDQIYSRPGIQLLQDDDKPIGPHWAEWMEYQKGQAPASDAVKADLEKVKAVVENLGKSLDAAISKLDGMSKVLDGFASLKADIDGLKKNATLPDIVGKLNAEVTGIKDRIRELFDGGAKQS